MMRFSRVVCIFFMMSVHLYPYGDNPSILNGGLLWPVGMIWVDFLGRASVATLSFVSGYLLWLALANKTILSILRQKFLVLIVPMMTWNVIFIAAAIIFLLLGANPDVLPDFRDPMAVVNAVTGVLGPTANYSLFFIRDLFVSSALIMLAWPLLRRAPIMLLVLVAGLTLFKLTEPVIFRPMILLFMLSGCLLHEKGLRLHELAVPRIALPIILGCFLLSVLVGAEAALLPGVLVTETRGFLLRLALIATILMIARVFVMRGMDAAVSAFESGAYLTYLSHVLLAKFLWEVFSAAGTNPNGVAYILYFLVTPVVIFWTARYAVTPLRRLPGFLPRMLTGKPRLTAVRARPAAYKGVKSSILNEKNDKGRGETRASRHPL